jgi:hypothetical protein
MPETVVLQGRSGLVNGAASALSGGIDKWLAEERARDLGGTGSPTRRPRPRWPRCGTRSRTST